MASEPRDIQAVRDALVLIGRIIETGKGYARDEIPGARKSPVGSGTEIALDHYKDAMRDGLAALDRLAAKQGWRPISEAPFGRDLWLVAEANEYHVAKYGIGSQTKRLDGIWWDWTWTYKPTHFMEIIDLPPPPSAGQEKKDG